MANPHRRAVIINCDIKKEFVINFLLEMLIHGVILAKT